MPKVSLRCKSCSHEFEGEYHSLIDRLKCPNCDASGPIFGRIEDRQFRLLDTGEGYDVTLGMLEDVLERYYSESRYYRKDLVEFIEDRLNIRLERSNDSFVFGGHGDSSFTLEEIYGLLCEDPATKREVYSMWMGISR